MRRLRPRQGTRRRPPFAHAPTTTFEGAPDEHPYPVRRTGLCLLPGDSHDGPFQIRIAVEDMAVSVPTSLFAVSLTETLRMCDCLNRKLGLDRAAWTDLVERCMHPPGGDGRTVH